MLIVVPSTCCARLRTAPLLLISRLGSLQISRSRIKNQVHCRPPEREGADILSIELWGFSYDSAVFPPRRSHDDFSRGPVLPVGFCQGSGSIPSGESSIG